MQRIFNYHSIVFGFFLLFLCITSLGGLAYFFVDMNAGRSIAVALASAALSIILFRYTYTRPAHAQHKPVNALNISALTILIFIGCAGLLWYLVTHAHDAAFQTPWAVIGYWFFLVFFTIVVAALIGTRTNSLHPLAASAILFAAVSIVAFIVPEGFGYDGHVHRATARHITEHGFITPKTIYYSGYYAFVVVMQRMLWFVQDAILYIDIFLVPLLFAVTLPVIVYRRYGHTLPALAVLLTPVVPLAIVSTPQNTAFILLLLLAVLLYTKEKISYVLPLLLCAAILLIHPLAGLPALWYTALHAAYTHVERIHIKKYAMMAIVLCGAASVPLAFAAQTLLASGTLDIPDIGARAQSLLHALPGVVRFGDNYFSALYNAIYTLQFLLWPLVVASAAYACVKRRNPLPFLFAAALCVSAGILYFMHTHLFVIQYEQGDFALRLVVMAGILLVAPALETLHVILLVMMRQSRTRLLTYLVVPCLMLANVYLAYPRVDRAFVTHGYSTRTADIATVRFIHEHASDTPYVVLANQQVSAAALDIFGFERKGVSTYFDTQEGRSYFYPIPTGGHLYSYYLEMVFNGPERATALEAMRYAGVSRLYLVVNDYWSNSKEIIRAAKSAADETLDMLTKENSVFLFVDKGE